MKIVLVYTNQTSGFIKGREFRYANPEWFDSVKKDVAKVVVIGDWPKVVEAYKNLGVPVVVASEFDPEAHGIDKGPVAEPIAPKADAPNSPVVTNSPAIDPSQVVIPEEWEKMPWVSEDPEGSVRTLAMKFTTEPVINRGQAQRIVQAEVDRRAGKVAE